ncbi:MAG TPA: hypothetical protein VJI12_02300 [archaeon]|nr:hypothetical protein [archaeon]
MADEPLRIDIELSPDNNQDYLAWNVAGCVRMLRDVPHEHEITLMVYELHKNVLRRQGVTEEELSVGDRYVEQAKRDYLHPTN